MIPLLRTLFGVMLGGFLTRMAALLSRLHTTEATSHKIARRGFVRNAALGAVLVILAQIGAGTVRLLWPNKTGAFGKELTVSAANIPPVDGTPFTNTQGKFYLVHTSDGLMALYWKCPHLGCTVPWNEDEKQFHCPCHQSQYNRHGERVAGPAPRPLELMAAHYDANGNVIVNTGAVTERKHFEPDQALPPLS
jgi:cytochrome b6-f complex iron-sulfur subunit